jgi:glycyl-tRNA synthetase beta chain
MSVSKKSLLIEIRTEELPPKSLLKLSNLFTNILVEDLRNEGLLEKNSEEKSFVTPRRLAILITKVRNRAPVKQVEVQGPNVKISLDANGNPTEALLGFARKRGIDVNKLERRTTSKGEFYFYVDLAVGSLLETNLDIKVQTALERLPISKNMRWGEGNFQFVRPVHGLIMMHGSKLIPGNVMGIESSKQTIGHRFLSKKNITITSADNYEIRLKERGNVIANFNIRRNEIKNKLNRIEKGLAREIARKPDGRIPAEVESLVIDTDKTDPLEHIFPRTTSYEKAERALNFSGGSDLLDEVTALVEWPHTYYGQFDEEFLSLPVECLALTMKKNQKYFPVFDKSANLLPYFVVISNNHQSSPIKINNQTEEPLEYNIKIGNERVLRPRLADARFFYDQDRKTKLEDRVNQLSGVIYHNKLGTQYDRVTRIKSLANYIADEINANIELVNRTAELSKADLLTDMVNEFPELQGIIGHYYAIEDGESEIVANAIEDHYRPRFAGDRLPQGNAAKVVALADKTDSLVGFFGIGQQPTGDKDSFGLRRAALGVLRILIEDKLDIDLESCLKQAAVNHAELIRNENVINEVFEFMMERLRQYYIDRDIRPDVFDAVQACRPTCPFDFDRRINAVTAFTKLPEAESLAAANKRIQNILRQAGYEITSAIDGSMLKEDAEINLKDHLGKVAMKVIPLTANKEYTEALNELSRLRDPVDAFFDNVMVMVDDEVLRIARLQLLAEIRREFQQIADVSRLQG